MEPRLETALAELKNNLTATFKSARAALAEVKKAQVQAGSGQLRELGKSLAQARSEARRFADEMALADASWKFDAEQYLMDGGYLKEFLSAAADAGLKVFERDGRIYCFPMLLRISAKDSAVLIDRKPERRLQPRTLVELLLRRQKRPQRFNEQKLLDTLFEVYCRMDRRWLRDWTKETRGQGPYVPLVEMYEVMTLLPGSDREYPKEEFTRDLYLLDLQRNLRTKDGRSFDFAAAAMVKGSAAWRLTMVDREGAEKIYATISFNKE